MKKLLTLIWPAIFFISLSTSIAASEKIRLTTGEWLPYLSEGLKHNGVGAHIVKKAFSLEGIEVEIRFFPWA